LLVLKLKAKAIPQMTSRKSTHECAKVVRPTHRPPLPHRKYSWYSYLLQTESTRGP